MRHQDVVGAVADQRLPMTDEFCVSSANAGTVNIASIDKQVMVLRKSRPALEFTFSVSTVDILTAPASSPQSSQISRLGPDPILSIATKVHRNRGTAFVQRWLQRSSLNLGHDSVRSYRRLQHQHDACGQYQRDVRCG